MERENQSNQFSKKNFIMNGIFIVLIIGMVVFISYSISSYTLADRENKKLLEKLDIINEERKKLEIENQKLNDQNYIIDFFFK